MNWLVVALMVVVGEYLLGVVVVAVWAYLGYRHDELPVADRLRWYAPFVRALAAAIDGALWPDTMRRIVRDAIR